MKIFLSPADPAGGSPSLTGDAAPAATVSPPADQQPAVVPKAAEQVLADAPPVSPDPKAEPAKEPDKAPDKVAEPKKDEPAKAEPLTAEKLKLPEGMKADDPVLGKALSLFNEDGVSADKAQRYVDLWNAQVEEVALAPYKAWKETQDKWVGEIKADAEIGGKNFDVMRVNFSRALEAVSQGDKGFQQQVRDALNATGAGNNPAVVKFINRLSLAVVEGNFISGGAAQSQRSYAERLYPNGSA